MSNSEKIFHSIFQHNGNAIAIIDNNLASGLYNNEFCRIIGFDENGQTPIISFDKIISDKKASKEFAELLQLIIAGNSTEKSAFNCELVTQNGGKLDVCVSLAKLPGEKMVIATFSIVGKIREAEELKKCEQKLKNIIKSNPIPQFVIDSSRKIIYWNTAIAELTGISSENAEGRPYQSEAFYDDNRPSMAELVLLKDEEELEKLFGKNLSKNSGNQYSFKAKTFLPKQNRWVLVTSSQISDSEDNIIGAFETIEDITNIKETEDSLKIINRQLEDIIEFLPDATFIISKDGKVNAWNRSIEEMTGVSKKDIIGKDHENAAVPFYGYPRKYLVDFLSDMQKNVTEYNFLERKRDSVFGEAYAPALYNGRGAYIWAIASYLKAVNGEVIGAIESIRDISRYKNAEESLRISKESYRDLYDNNPSMYFTIDSEGIILSVNKFGCEELGYSIDELIGDSVLKVFYEEDKPVAVEKSKLCIENIGHVFNWELRKVRKDGSMLWVKETARALKNTEGKVIIFIVCEDITDQKETEKALIESELRYKELYDDNPSMYFTIAPNGIVLSVNRFGCEQLGYNNSELVGHPVLNVFHEEDKAKATEFLKLCVEEIGRVFRWELRKVRKNGSLIWVKETGRALVDAKNNIVVFIVCEDITEKKRAEEYIQESERKYRQLVNNSFVGIYMLKNDKIRFCNQKFADYLGYDSPQELIGKDFRIIIAPESIQKVENEIRLGNLGQKESSHYELKGLKKDGSVFDAEVISSRIIMEGKPVTQGTLLDISERKRNEREINKLSRAVEQNPSGIMITDLNGNIEYVNPSFERITGYSLGEIKGKNFRILKQGYINDNFYTQMWNAIIKGNDWRGEYQSVRKNGQIYWESTSVSAIKNDAGEITHFISVEEDITGKKELEIELKQAVDRAEESIRLKSSLLSNMSHELRTPLTGILGLSQILMEELIDSHFAALVKKIYLSGRRLMITLNSILDLSELESNATLLKITEYDICSEVSYLLSQYAVAAKDKGLSFEIEVKDRNLFAFVDERLCNQIITNLVDNAIKYTIHGGVKVEIKNSINGEAKYLSVSVIDTGIGIAEENISIIFEEFRQVSEGYNRSFEGAGLGLTLVKKMLYLLHGEIMVESSLGEGSTFTVLLPAVENVGNIETEQIEGSFSKLEMVPAEKILAKVLLVEDNEINMEVIKCYIESFCEVDGSDNGIEAINMAAQKKYDIILMDINLGNDMDGVTATKEIRKIKGYEKTPVVAITGYALSGDKEKLLSEGLTHYLPKPFEKEELQRLLKGIIEH